jgi:hypothetical protein
VVFPARVSAGSPVSHVGWGGGGGVPHRLEVVRLPDWFSGSASSHRCFQRNDLRRKITFSVVKDRPDILLCKNFQEFRIEQGVSGSQYGLELSTVQEKWGIGGCELRKGSGKGFTD